MYRKLIYESAAAGVKDLLNIIYSKLKDAVGYPKSEMFRNMRKFIELAYENSELEKLEPEPAMDSFDTFDDLWVWFVNTVNESFKGSKDITDTSELLKRVKEYIDQNYHTDRISLGYLSKRFYINQFRLCKLFKSEYKENFQNYIINKRIEKAKELLLDSKIKIYEVSELVGYEDVKYFSRIFKKYTGYSPNEFREQRKNY
jgi:YesN/AraC family two-component response regulator